MVPVKLLALNPSTLIEMLVLVVSVVAPVTTPVLNSSPPIVAPPARIRLTYGLSYMGRIVPLTVTSISLPGGTSICASSVLPVLDGADTSIVSTPAPPPSLPMISLVIANLNPRNLV